MSVRRCLSFAPAVLLVAACADAPPPAPVTPVAAPPAAPAKPTPVPVEPYVRLQVEPRVDPVKLVHVEAELGVVGPVGTFRLARGAAGVLTNVALSDDAGTIDAKVVADGEGLVLALSRAPAGVTHLRYDVVANADPAFDPLAERVLDDRFVGSGEGLFLLPDGLDDEVVPIELALSGGPLRAPNAATSLGLGPVRRTKGRPRMLRHLGLLVGSLGGAVFDTAGEHDEAAWLGYTAFDPRPAAAEVAEVRSAMGELFHEQGGPPWTLLLATSTRPVGSYSTTPRTGGALLEAGPGEPWSAPLRISIAQQLVRPWIGGELWIGPHDAAHVSLGYWFSEGVARFFVTRLLARLGLVRPDDVRDALVGESSVILTSHHKGESNAKLAAVSATDDIARAHLVARGALYAARLNALVRQKSKGTASLESVMLGLVDQARKARAALPLSAWTDGLTQAVGPQEATAFDKAVEQGDEVVLPAGVLGHCYRAGTGDYVGFDLGYDGFATLMSKRGEVVGLEPNGPAARAGLRPGDVIVDAEYKEGHSEVPVKLTVKREPATVQLTYAPKGQKYRGPTWTRVPGTTDEQCGDAW